jgi:hypothetical protein
VKADGEIISMILSLCGELVFARPTNMQRSQFDATPISSLPTDATFGFATKQKRPASDAGPCWF